MEVLKRTVECFILPFSGIVKQAERPYLQGALGRLETSAAIPYLEDEGGERDRMQVESRTGDFDGCSQEW